MGRERQLEESERRWLKTGTPEDEAAYFAWALRTTEIEEKTLELVASLAEEEARSLFEGEVRSDLFRPLNRIEFPARDQSEALFLQLGAERSLRVSLPLAWSTLGLWSALFPDDSRPQAAIEAAEDWLLCPCADHKAICLRAEELADAAGDRTIPFEFEDSRAIPAQEAADDARACAGLPVHPSNFYDLVGWRLRGPIEGEATT